MALVLKYEGWIGPLKAKKGSDIQPVIAPISLQTNKNARRRIDPARLTIDRL
jgi:hypothetical protein